MESTINFKVERIHRLENSGPMKAFADFVINDSFLIRGLRIIEGKKGLFISMPQEKGKNDRWYDTVSCLSKDVRVRLSKSVLAAYEENIQEKQ